MQLIIPNVRTNCGKLNVGAHYLEFNSKLLLFHSESYTCTLRNTIFHYTDNTLVLLQNIIVCVCNYSEGLIFEDCSILL